MPLFISILAVLIKIVTKPILTSSSSGTILVRKKTKKPTNAHFKESEERWALPVTPNIVKPYQMKN
jgi:hypothetical protein